MLLLSNAELKMNQIHERRVYGQEEDRSGDHPDRPYTED